MIHPFTTLSPSWSIPNVKAYTILAFSSDSSPVSFGYDNPLVADCRKKIEQLIKPAYPMLWLKQVHGNRVLELPFTENKEIKDFFDPLNIEADGTYTFHRRTVCTIVTADCLPIVFASKDGTRVGVAHAGRKGLEKDIISEMIKKINIPADEIYVWIGPGIASESYPVSREIRDEVLSLSPAYESVFAEGETDQFLMDLYLVANIQLASHGIPKENIDGAAWNTYTDKRFHSARRDKAQSGRMATVVWME
ncbi:MAG: peptidoglycan editing factor PgeF [Bacteroidales bacterium]|nr:peptidoglycan editing factor PgeF [Bacteroidales bacterium]